MTEQELAGNKAIHEFMGWKWFDKRYPRNHGIGAPEAFEGTNDIIIQKSKYHSSWDWLMPVVEKINFMDNYAYDVIIWRNDCHINDKTEIIFKGSRRIMGETLIGIVWETVIQFIQWYNNQLKR